MLNKNLKGLISVPSNQKKKEWCPRCEEFVNSETHSCHKGASK